jgi:hypothetical protein
LITQERYLFLFYFYLWNGKYCMKLEITSSNTGHYYIFGLTILAFCQLSEDLCTSLFD